MKLASPRLAQRTGLTLLELVVVLAILAALTAAASVATENILAQRRFEMTQQSLDAARVAVLGRNESTATSDESPMDGFVADIGRLPRAVGSDPAFQVGELWSNPNALMRFQMQQSPLDSEVWLACGWRGPYLRMPAGTTALNDGWGRPFVILTTDVSGVPAPATAGQDIMGLASLGSDNTVGMSATGPAAWSKDLMASFYDVEGTVNAHWLANVQVRVWQRSELGDKIPPADSGTLVVRLFLPNPTTGAIASIDSTPLPGPFSTIPVVSFPQIPIGPKVLRAYWTLADSSVRKSQPLPIQVTRTGAVNWELVLPYVAPAPEPTPTP